MRGNFFARINTLAFCLVLVICVLPTRLTALANIDNHQDKAVRGILGYGITSNNANIIPSNQLLFDNISIQVLSAPDLWVDAISGNDRNDGLTPATAFRSIQKAANIASPGTTVHILPGIYRETVQPSFSGTATKPIIYRAENGPDTVIIRGSVQANILNWNQLATNSIGLRPGVDPSNIYFTDLSAWNLDSLPRFVIELDASGQVAARLPLAREPDWQVTTEWKYAEFWWAADGGSTIAACDPASNQNPDCDSPSRSTTQLIDRINDNSPAGIEPGNLTTLGNLTGATLVALDTDEGHYIYRRKIVAHNVTAGKITIDRPCEFDSGSGTPGLGWGSKYYVENHPALIDTPGEWWYDSNNSRLYLWPSEPVNPAMLNIEISRRDDGFMLNELSYIILDGLTMEFFDDAVIHQSQSCPGCGSYHNTIRNVTLRYANTGIELGQGTDYLPNVTDGFTLENSEISHMDSLAIEYNYWWSGGTANTFKHAGIVNTVIRNNEFYDLGFRTDGDNAIGILFMHADKLRFVGNYVHHVAQNGMAFSRSIIQSTKTWGFSPEEIKTGHILIKDNVFEKACLLNADCGELKIQGSVPDNHVFRDLLITGNTFRNTFGWTYISEKRGRWSGGTSSDLQGMGGFGLYLDHASGVHVYRNIAYNNSSSAFHLYSNWWDGDIVYFNNIAANSLNGIRLDGWASHGNFNTQIANNIIINNEGYGILIYHNQGDYGNFLLENNLYYLNGWRAYAEGGLWRAGDMAIYGLDKYYQTLSAIQANTPWENYGVEGNPAFEYYNSADHDLFDSSWPDFHLTSASTNAIDRGSTVLPGSLSTLLNTFGVVDNQIGLAFDIGRYEAGVPIPIPGNFLKTLPVNNAINLPTNLILTWKASSDATEYEYCIDTTNDNECTSWENNGIETRVTLYNLASSTSYYWQVRALNSYGTTYANGSSTEFWTFTTGSTPVPFNKIYPTNGAINRPANLNLKWGASSGADRYEYCIDKTNDNLCSTWVNISTSTSKFLSGLAPSTTYFWQVRAINTFGTIYANGEKNAFWSFTTGTKPLAFDKISPNNGATNLPANPALNWNASSGAARYEYCIDKTYDNNCFTWVNIGTATSNTLSKLAANTNYYWQVRAINTYGTTYANGGKIAFWSFKTGLRPSVFNKISPASGTLNQPANPDLMWGTSSNATKYAYCVDTTNDNKCSTWLGNGTNKNVTLNSLTSNITYYWQVRAVNTFGIAYADGSNTSFWSFKTGVPAPFSKTSPISGTTGQPADITLSWKSSSYGTNYEYCYDTTDDMDCTNWVDTGISTSAALIGLSPETIYYWQVRATNDFGTTYANGSNTSFWSFKTGTLPLAFSKTLPINGATNQPTNLTLIWSTSTNVSRYEYCIDTTNDNNCSDWITNGTATSKTLSGLATTTSYFWQVRSVNTFGSTYANGFSTDFSSFTTGSAPNPFDKITLTNGANNQPLNPILSWGKSIGVDNYEFCIDTTNDNSCSIWVNNGMLNNIIINELNPNTTYFWQIRAVNSIGNTYANQGQSTFWSFTTGINKNNIMPALLTEVKDNLGNKNSNSWSKGTDLDWSCKKSCPDLTLQVGDTVTLTVNAFDPNGLPLEYMFIYLRNGVPSTAQDWSGNNTFEWRVKSNDVGTSNGIITYVRNNDGNEWQGKGLGDDSSHEMYLVLDNPF